MRASLHDFSALARRNTRPGPGVVSTICCGCGFACKSTNSGFQKIAAATILSQCACTFSGACFSGGVLLLQNCRTKGKMCGISESGAVLALLYFQRTAPAPPSS